LTENAISSLGKNAEGRSVLDASASAILGSLADASSTNPTKEQMQADMDKAKPRPRANLDAEKPEDVYPLETLVGSNMLREVNVKSWTDAVAKGEDVPTTSLFVSRNLVRIVKTKDAKQIKALRALLIMIQWYKGLKPGGREGKKLPKKEDMADAVPGVESRVLDIMRSRFASNA
jgi:DNA-directed RNA polymerase I subunit RPA49